MLYLDSLCADGWAASRRASLPCSQRNPDFGLCRLLCPPSLVSLKGRSLNPDAHAEAIVVSKVSIQPAIADRDAGHPVWIGSVNGLYKNVRAAHGNLYHDSADTFPTGSKGVPETVYIMVTLGSLHEVCGVIKEWLKRQGRTVTVTVRDESGEHVTILDGSLPDEAIVEVLRPAVRSEPDE